MTIDIDSLDFDKANGVVTVVAQHAISGAVLMVAQSDREALARTLATGEMHYRSRTRGLWHKGATSGNTQHVVSLHPDCDRDSVLALVIPAGPACHTLAPSCFGDAASAADALSRLDQTILDRSLESRELSEGRRPSYTKTLLADRNLRLKKIAEEAGELITACADNDGRQATEEAADLLYYTMVALRAFGCSLDDIRLAIAARARDSG